jgi:ectoine hydroxylase-related dioxygenase (phytanoyl-CoA dioxygenase family)
MTTTAASAELKLSPEQIRSYHDEGYLLVRGLIPRAAIQPLREEMHRIDDAQSVWPDEHIQIIDPAVMKHPSGKGPLVIGVQLPAQRSDDFKRVADHPNLRAAMSQILGGEVKRFTDQCGNKTRHVDNEQGGRTFYHQDSYYWRLDPRLGCNCWIPFDEVGRDAIA